ncbi:hypothetical protein HHK36_004718 [Tetracentron sinense]|uniref:Uncharacterized protein n=1 Tax=Tetracentron sinense TaxID=13715 RepID=A0A834ZN81_TETSI|nr:hypothetical protein HHK36_004718 [Tetracentron sinense]
MNRHGSSSQLMGPSQGYPPNHDVAPEPHHHEASQSSGVPPLRRTRGPNKAIPPPPPGQDRILVPIINLGPPTGNEAGKLSRFIGTLMKDGDILPIITRTGGKLLTR